MDWLAVVIGAIGMVIVALAIAMAVILTIAVKRVRRREANAEIIASSARRDIQDGRDGRERQREIIPGADEVQTAGMKMKVSEQVLAIKNPDLPANKS